MICACMVLYYTTKLKCLRPSCMDGYIQPKTCMYKYTDLIQCKLSDKKLCFYFCVVYTIIISEHSRSYQSGG